MADHPASLRRAHKFGLAASFRIAMSSAWLATIRFSRAFWLAAADMDQMTVTTLKGVLRVLGRGAY